VQKTVEILNRLVAEGLVQDYAIAGGMAAIYYAEAVLTYDLDVYCKVSGSGINILGHIYQRLQDLGFASFDRDGNIVVVGVPVQFIPVHDAMTEEALKNSVSASYGVPTKVLRIEYLIAIYLKVFRPKDRAKLILLLEESHDKNLLADILSRHKLVERYQQFQRQGSTVPADSPKERLRARRKAASYAEKIQQVGALQRAISMLERYAGRPLWPESD